MQRHFETPGPVEVRVDNRAGPVELRTHPGATTDVELSASGPAGEELVEAARVEHRTTGERHRVVVEIPVRGRLAGMLRRGGTEVTVTVRLPEGSDIDVTTAAGDVTAAGRYGSARMSTASGDLSVERAERELDAKTASGDVAVGSVGAAASVATASGDVRCGTLERGGRLRSASGDVTVEVAGAELEVHTASGDVTAGRLDAGGQFKTASGDQRIRRLVAGTIRLDTATGDLIVAVARGTAVAVDAETTTGSLHSDIDLDAEEPAAAGGPRAELRARTASGDVRIERADPA